MNTNISSLLNVSQLASRENAWKAVAAGAGILTTIVVRQAVTAGWRAVKKQDPPANPASPDTSWQEAIAWTLATSAAIGIARLIATRGVDSLWTKVTGSPPPGQNNVG